MKNHSPARWLATGLGAGFLPIAPGTWGSAEAVVIAAAVIWAVPAQAFWVIAGLCVLATVAGIPAATAVSRQETAKDPSIVVIDEVAGQFLTFLLIPLSLPWLVAGFFVFRIFDIVKPFPARQIEALPEGWGIMLDDLVAGLYAGLLLMLVERFL